jgi:hypothetical protein
MDWSQFQRVYYEGVFPSPIFIMKELTAAGIRQFSSLRSIQHRQCYWSSDLPSEGCSYVSISNLV